MIEIYSKEFNWLLRVSKYAALLQKPEALKFLGKRHKAQQQKYNKPRHLL